jgi:hypothetical protein
MRVNDRTRLVWGKGLVENHYSKREYNQDGLCSNESLVKMCLHLLSTISHRVSAATQDFYGQEPNHLRATRVTWTQWRRLKSTLKGKKRKSKEIKQDRVSRQCQRWTWLGNGKRCFRSLKTRKISYGMRVSSFKLLRLVCRHKACKWNRGAC